MVLFLYWLSCTSLQVDILYKENFLIWLIFQKFPPHQCVRLTVVVIIHQLLLYLKRRFLLEGCTFLGIIIFHIFILEKHLNCIFDRHLDCIFDRYLKNFWVEKFVWFRPSSVQVLSNYIAPDQIYILSSDLCFCGFFICVLLYSVFCISISCVDRHHCTWSNILSSNNTSTSNY